MCLNSWIIPTLPIWRYVFDLRVVTDNLKSYLFQVGAKECLICFDDIESNEDTIARVQGLFEKCGVHVIEAKKCVHILIEFQNLIFCS
jgi:hypothetical protein